MALVDQTRKRLRSIRLDSMFLFLFDACVYCSAIVITGRVKHVKKPAFCQCAAAVGNIPGDDRDLSGSKDCLFTRNSELKFTLQDVCDLLMRMAVLWQVRTICHFPKGQCERVRVNELC